MALTTVMNPWIFVDDDFFNNFERSLNKSVNRLLNVKIPMDIHEYEKEYKIYADVPGYDSDDITIEEHQGVLTIKAQKETKKEENKYKVVNSERSYKSFVRTFTLPENANVSNILAGLDKGVLEVTIPKKTVLPDEKRRIKIN